MNSLVFSQANIAYGVSSTNVKQCFHHSLLPTTILKAPLSPKPTYNPSVHLTPYQTPHNFGSGREVALFSIYTVRAWASCGLKR